MMNSSKITSVAMLAATSLLFGCSTTSRLQHPLRDVLQSYGYSTYTPFRTTDYPGSIFVLSRNHEGRWTELTLANYAEAYDIAPQTPFSDAPQEVGMPDLFTRTHQLKAGVAFELVSFAIKPELAYTHSTDITIRLKSPKKSHVMSLTRFTDIATRLNPSTRNVISNLKADNRMGFAYVVMETLTVEGIELDITLKPGIKATLGLEKLKELASLDASIESKSENSITIKYLTPMIIGYKATPLPQNVVDGEVSPIFTFEPLPAEEINRIKAL